jgi:hypothetical protein
MADQTKLEEMLERLINGDKEGAEELFHEYTIQKSREIYESLLEDEEEVDEADDEEVEEASDDEDLDESADEDEDEEVEEDFNLDEFEVEADPMGGDPADDMMGDIGGDDMDMDMDMDDEEGEEGDMEDRVEDLEDALDELKAEFEKMMAGEEGEDEEGDDDMDMDMDSEEEPEEESFAFEADEDEEDKKNMKKGSKSAGETMKEYVEKVTANMGDNGANTKSTVAGKNDMGGTASNIVSGGESKGEGTQGGLANPSAKEDNAGNVNVPGGKASKSMKNQPKGHGAEKKGSGDNGANTKSTIGS